MWIAGQVYDEKVGLDTLLILFLFGQDLHNPHISHLGLVLPSFPYLCKEWSHYPPLSLLKIWSLVGQHPDRYNPSKTECIQVLDTEERWGETKKKITEKRRTRWDQGRYLLQQLVVKELIDLSVRIHTYKQNHIIKMKKNYNYWILCAWHSTRSYSGIISFNENTILR